MRKTVIVNGKLANIYITEMGYGVRVSIRKIGGGATTYRIRPTGNGTYNVTTRLFDYQGNMHYKKTHEDKSMEWVECYVESDVRFHREGAAA